MTAFEAISTPGCGLLIALAVGGLALGACAFFDASTMVTACVAAFFALASLLPTAWGVMRVINRPVVLQLIDPSRAQAAVGQLGAAGTVPTS